MVLLEPVRMIRGWNRLPTIGITQVDQWFFTTRAAAEEYYYSKANPEGLDVVRLLSMGLL